jgi:hypothetical protein
MKLKDILKITKKNNNRISNSIVIKNSKGDLTNNGYYDDKDVVSISTRSYIMDETTLVIEIED